MAPNTRECRTAKKPAAASEPAPAEEKPAASPAGHSLPRPDQALAPGAAAGVKMPAPEPVVGSVNVRYNHYNSAFEIVDGRLLFEVVDVEYCISFVFKGAWRARLYSAADGSMCARVDGLAPTTDEGRENPQICFGFDGQKRSLAESAAEALGAICSHSGMMPSGWKGLDISAV